MKYFGWFVLLVLLFLPPISYAAPSLSGPETARLFTDEMSRVFDIHFKGDTSLLEDGTHFTAIVMDEEKMQLRFESKAFFEATGKNLSCIVGKDRAQITLTDTWDDAVNDVGNKVMEPLALFHGEQVSDSGVKVFFRSAGLEFEKMYYEIVISAKGERSNPKITLGYYRKERAKEIQTFSEPRAKWKIWSSPDGNTGYRAKVTMQRYKKELGDIFGSHTLEVGFDTGAPVLLFTPGLYPWANTDSVKEQKKYLREVTGIRIDQIALPGSAEGRLSGDAPVQKISIPLDQESFGLIGKGKSIQFDLVTTLDERVQVIFPLKNAQKVIATAARVTALSKVSPLMALVAMKDYPGVEQAIERGVDVNLSSPDKTTAMSIAVKMKDSEMILLLGAAEDLDTEVRTPDGDGYLHIAAHYQRGTDVLQALLEIGCDPDIKDSTGRTPLSRTVCYRGFGKIESLLNAGADINARDNKGYGPLHHTVRNRFASPEETAFLLKAGADGDSRSTEGDTPLMVAVNNQCWGHIKALMAGEVNLKAKNKAGLTVLDIARTFRDSKDLPEQIPALILQGEDAVQKTRDAYKNLVSILENKSLYHYGFHNITDETVYLALRILGSDDQWTTKSWAKLKPGERGIIARSPNRVFYFFADSESYTWKGTDNTVAINGKKYGMRKLKLKSKNKGELKYYKLK